MTRDFIPDQSESLFRPFEGTIQYTLVQFVLRTVVAFDDPKSKSVDASLPL